MPSFLDLFTEQDSNETSRHYCKRLAAIVLLPAYIESFKSALTSAEQREILKDSQSWEALANCLLKSPRLQSIAASSTSYTPSVWLLEQELIARGIRDQVCEKHA